MYPTLTILAAVAITAMSALPLRAQETTTAAGAFAASYAYETSGNYTQAAATIKKIYDATVYEHNLRLGWLHYMAANYKESAEYYRRASALLPLSVEARLGLAMPLQAMGNNNEAIVVYKELLKTDAGNYFGNYRLGLVYYQQGKYAEALKHFELLLNHYPFEYDILHMTAWTYYRLGKLREAKVLFQKALLNRPNDSSALEGLGLIK